MPIRDELPAPREASCSPTSWSSPTRSEWYAQVFDAQVLRERDPVMLRAANSWLIRNEGGGPTDDKPDVTLTTPQDPSTTNAFLNVRVAEIGQATGMLVTLEDDA